MKPVVGFIDLYPNGQPPEHVTKLKSEAEVCCASRISVMPNITKNIIWQTLAICGENVEGMDRVIKHFAQDHDIIIVLGMLKHLWRSFIF